MFTPVRADGEVFSGVAEEEARMEKGLAGGVGGGRRNEWVQVDVYVVCVWWGIAMS